MRLFYFSYKQVKHHYSLLRAYVVICGRFNITVNRDYCTPKTKVSSQVFVYNNSHLSLNLLLVYAYKCNYTEGLLVSCVRCGT